MDIQEKIKDGVKRIIVLTGLLTTPIMSFAYEGKLQQLNDAELSEVNGQALLSLGYLAPNDAANTMKGQGVGFYKLGLEAELELNANIKKLQLGCGGINGANGCDIDIDNLSLSGISDTREGRANSDAKLTNPFLEFAIKNPEKASTREVVGLRLSAEKVIGLLSAGTENSDKPNGINSLSGYLKIKDATGTAYTGSRTGVNYGNLGLTVSGKAKSTTGLITADFTSNDYALNLGEGSGTLYINGQTVSGNRMNSVNLAGTAVINNIALSGKINANAKLWGAIPIPLDGAVSGNITNLNVGVNVTESLGFIHKIPLNNPFSLSLQSQSILWPNAAQAAQKGWWLAIEDAIDIGDVSPTQRVNVTDDVIKQVIPYVSSHLQSNPIECGFLALDCLGGKFNINNVPLQNAKVNMDLTNLQLKNQTFAPNCYGNLKFC
ncbi:hypothetical protein RFI36_02575 [Acinetobacter gerneri]|uniref:Uncharacterized protein n=1 Tax=Acinetobacter gerneri TaxID=202952 RepID=A0AAW8JGW6_9GAMM|nr:hypothetical protein [Acinetobacter gerneri]MDQ9008720.1 hypothetical protein [Acinetobacter gerneri]MDQ9012732.1 hypothetical protein [Acinetobacter gerneri]MDQ9051496.1 hypothetical protein [Acinetobacter gerneri]MDQ9058719.1 hypothetical protein [Acinetobacter gerneri]MDQ9070677.1 hypothetical protein [Acinetobacter gerneri]